MQPALVLDAYDPGAHNSGEGAKRIKRAGLYKDCSTICIRPTRGVIPAKVVQTWENLAPPMNQQFLRLTVIGMEVGVAYSQAIEQVLSTPGLCDFKYILTLEEDNMPPPDGLLKLLEAAEEHPEFAAIGGLYWTKGEGGQPMIYGNPHEVPLNFRPQPPVVDANGVGQLVECNGLGMGFTLFRLDVFKDERIQRPWFETVQRYTGGNAQAYTQDLWFFQHARQAGYRVAAHCGVHVGHYDLQNDTVW